MAATTGRRSGPASNLPFLLRLYPAPWRERYGDEFRELLADRPPTLRDRLDVVAGAIDARLHPQVGRTQDDVPTRPDRSVAATLALGGVLLTVWAAVGASIAPRWDSGEIIEPSRLAMLGVSTSAGFLAAFVMSAGLLLIASRYDWYVGRRGAVGAVLTAAGLVFAGLGGGIPALVLLVGGTTMFAIGLRRRLIGTNSAALLLATTLLLVAAFVSFAIGGGQDPTVLWCLVAYGPAWLLVAADFRAPIGARVAEPTSPAISPTGA